MSEFNTIVWVCPIHGVILDDDLAEGIDHAKGIGLDGDVAWTSRFYCQFDHENDQTDEASEVSRVDLVDYLAQQGYL